MRKQKALDTYEDVKEKALRLLEYRSHSEYELRDKLRHNGAQDVHIDEAIEFCQRYGFLNDEAYARAKANDLMHLKKYGIRRIKAELRAKGIADHIIDEVLLNLDNDKQEDNLRNLLERKLKGDFSIKNKDKCLRYFTYRGYDLYDIKNIIREIEERAD